MTNKSTAGKESPKRLGRPELPPEKSKSKTVLIRMTDAHHEKYLALGGPEWMRQQIERAKVSA